MRRRGRGETHEEKVRRRREGKLMRRIEEEMAGETHT